MNVYLITEDTESFCVAADTMAEAVTLGEANYLRERRVEEDDYDENDETEYYHEQILESCQLVGELVLVSAKLTSNRTKKTDKIPEENIINESPDNSVVVTINGKQINLRKDNPEGKRYMLSYNKISAWVGIDPGSMPTIKYYIDGIVKTLPIDECVAPVNGMLFKVVSNL